MLLAYTCTEGILGAKACVGRPGGGRAGLAPALKVWEDPALFGNKCNIINVISGPGRGVVPSGRPRTHVRDRAEEGGNLEESAFFEKGCGAQNLGLNKPLCLSWRVWGEETPRDLTGIESMDQCRHTLEQHNWNIEAAVQDRLNEQEGVPSVFNPPPSRPLQGLLGWGYYLIMLPFRFTYYTILDIFRFALRFIRPDPRSRVTDPVGDIVSFMHSFEEKYGRAHPVFYQGTYSQALNDAKRELRFLLVYLHGDDHQDSDEFCRNTLCAPEVISLINTRMLFWACSTNKPEGYRVSQALRENTYPFLAMIMLKDRRMTVVGRLEGLIQPDDLINQLTFIIDANQTYLVSERLEREERNQTQVLRQQQDEAYLASLRADQEKERKKREERERKRRKEEEVKQQKLAEERRRQNLQEEKERKLERLPPEPSPDDPESVKIIFKLPNDSRVERRFHFSQSLTVIHDFLFSLKESPEKFQIEANFPRRVLPCIPSEEWPNPPTLQEAGLSHTEVLFVQDLTDE
ncbi:FAS-associated factor 2 [Myotis brandtii]|uniref:FAS-associated factor 2 n=1 Tax=Myotis brandtii TaxID=109478 RepID=S7MS73_MYOBR|nr:FAS-associated factor 2 [Myotis brandtii]